MKSIQRIQRLARKFLAKIRNKAAEKVNLAKKSLKKLDKAEGKRLEVEAKQKELDNYTQKKAKPKKKKKKSSKPKLKSMSWGDESEIKIQICL